MERNQPYRLQVPVGRPTNATQATDYLIAAALKRNASDIHLGVNHTDVVPEPFLLRFRTHGKLQAINGAFLVPIYKEVVARLKVLAGLNTTEIGTPQDGQINLLTGEGPVVLRLSIIPGPDGDEVVIRVQRGQRKNQSINELGLKPALLSALQRLISQKSGLIAITGPAGSGKTSTIYALLQTLASPERKVLTAEDPIETRLPFVSHTQVSAKTNYSALARAFMRQDSEVIFIGEVRDIDSAGAAVQLAQTGHLVLTTLHTRDAVGVISRLAAFEVHANFIANSLIGCLAQRLIPRLCAQCRVPDPQSQSLLAQFREIPAPPPGTQLFKPGQGCSTPGCNAGYTGRKAVFELLTLDPELSDMINRGAPRAEIFNNARKKGMQLLAEDILASVYAGECDLAAVKGYLLGPGYSFAVAAPSLKAA